MAILTVDSLTGCSSIPSFMGGSADTPLNPTISTFWQTNAPTSWTKVTTWDNTGLRVIGAANGTPITTGGTLPFTQTFTSRSVGPGNSQPTNIIGTQISQSSISLNSPQTGAATNNPFATQPTTITGLQTPPHTHGYPRYDTPLGSCQNVAPTTGVSGTAQFGTLTSGGPSVAAAAHSHPVSAPHVHGITVAQHSHDSSPTALGIHFHAYSGSYDFSILYVDVILATKD